MSNQLAPVRPDFIAECLHKLKSGGMMVPKGIAAADFLNEYSIALSGVPEHGLKVAVVKLKRGEYPDITPEFMPLPAALAAIARLECRALREDVVRLRDKKASIEEATRKPVNTPEERARQLARIREIHARFKTESRALVEAQRGITHEPLDAEQAAYWSTIAAMPDASKPTAEQKAFRRKMESEIEAAPQPEPAPEKGHVDIEF